MYIHVYIYIYIYIYRERERERYIPRPVQKILLCPPGFALTAPPSHSLFGTGFMGIWLNGYLVLQGNIPLRTSACKNLLKLLAGKRLGTRWAK